MNGFNLIVKYVLPVEFLWQVFQAQFPFEVTASVYRIESIFGFVGGDGQRCCDGHLRF